MADVKISGLPASTTPLAGTEVLPIVQGTTTKQVSVANLTAGRDLAALSLTTAAVQATNSAGLALKSSAGTSQIIVGAGGSDNVTISVATNITPANAAVAISPTGTGTVTINPATASTMNNVSVGQTTAAAGAFTNVFATSASSAYPGAYTDGVMLDYTTGIGRLTTGAAAALAIYNGGPASRSEKARFFSSGGVSIGNTTDPGAANLSVNGNIQFPVNGKGIDFSATAGGGSSSNILADYEEGTFTPVFTGTGGNPTVTYTVQTGKYIKIGNQVSVFVGMVTSAASGGSGNLGVSGLPYLAGSGGNAVTSINFAWNFNPNYPQCMGVSGTTFVLYSAVVASNNTQALLSSVTGSGSVYFYASATYTVL